MVQRITTQELLARVAQLEEQLDVWKNLARARRARIRKLEAWVEHLESQDSYHVGYIAELEQKLGIDTEFENPGDPEYSDEERELLAEMYDGVADEGVDVTANLPDFVQQVLASMRTEK